MRTYNSMQRLLSSLSSSLKRQDVNVNRRKICDVFISHRGADTKRGVASLLYDHLTWQYSVRCFLDNKNMKPGDKLFDNINDAINKCKIGVAVFSPRFCDSYFCLHELALIMESKKKVIPIFCDVKPSQLHVVNDGTLQADDIRRFNSALEQAKLTVGLAFNSHEGNWADVVTNAGNIVVDSLMEIEREKYMRRRKHSNNLIYK